MIHISQLDPLWKDKKFPQTNYRYGDYGCLTSALCMLLGKTPLEFMQENPSGWLSSGDLKTDEVLLKYGYKLVRQAIAEGLPLPVRTDRYIARTSFMSPKYPTHFYVVNPDGTITDPGSSYNPKTENRYSLRTNEIRFLVKTGTPSLTLEQRVKLLKDKVFI